MLKKIIAEMPKAENPNKCHCKKSLPYLMTPRQASEDSQYHGFNHGINSQCQLLAEQGWRKVPSQLPDNWYDILRQRACTNCRDKEDGCYPCKITDWFSDGAKAILRCLLEV